jgi:hypothetical protein
MWRRINLVENGRYTVVIGSMLSLIAIAASEVSVERSLLRQRKIFGHPRTGMSRELISTRL